MTSVCSEVKKYIPTMLARGGWVFFMTRGLYFKSDAPCRGGGWVKNELFSVMYEWPLIARLSADTEGFLPS